jgi:hypothetical protein
MFELRQHRASQRASRILFLTLDRPPTRFRSSGHNQRMGRLRNLTKKKGCRGCLLVFVVVFVGAGLFYGPVIRDLMANGSLQSVVSKWWNDLWGIDTNRKYSGTSMQNLKALHTAMMLYHDSEERFPDSSGWMDAIEFRIKAGDMTQEEANKKLHDPTLGTDPNVFGYSMNDAASGKYKDDVKDPAKTPLLYTGKGTGRNAHGDPAKDKAEPPRPGGNLGVSVDGNVLRL